MGPALINSLKRKGETLKTNSMTAKLHAVLIRAEYDSAPCLSAATPNSRCVSQHGIWLCRVLVNFGLSENVIFWLCTVLVSMESVSVLCLLLETLTPCSVSQRRVTYKFFNKNWKNMVPSNWKIIGSYKIVLQAAIATPEFFCIFFVNSLLCYTVQSPLFCKYLHKNRIFAKSFTLFIRWSWNKKY